MAQETVLTFDVTTPIDAAQARLKISALVIGGYDVVSIEEHEKTDQETGARRRIRRVRLSGENPIRSDEINAPTSSIQAEEAAPATPPTPIE